MMNKPPDLSSEEPVDDGLDIAEQCGGGGLAGSVQKVVPFRWHHGRGNPAQTLQAASRSGHLFQMDRATQDQTQAAASGFLQAQGAAPVGQAPLQQDQPGLKVVADLWQP